MKWNILVATTVLTLGLSTQSFGSNLLDRMLGANGYGCEAKCGKGCDDKGGKDACQKAFGGLFGGKACQKGGDDKGTKDACQKGCGLFGGRACQKGGDDKGTKDACQKGCGPSLMDRIFGCSAKGKDACQKGGTKDPKGAAAQKGCCRRPLLNLDFGKGCSAKGSDCGTKDPKGGAAQKGYCGPSLMDRIFGGCHSKGSDCCQKGGTKDPKGGAAQKGGMKAEPEVAEEEAPAPPAPVVDPSAFLKSQRRVIHASTNLVR